jgi:glycosyltransferase involved in cell wall biosynthesis
VARNRGAAESRGEIIAFQDSDDLWDPTKLQRQVALLEKLGPAVPCCLCNVVMTVVDGKELTSFDISLLQFPDAESVWLNALEVLATRFVLFNQAVAIRRSAWQKIGGFREDVKYDEDYDLALRLALEGPWAMIKDPLVLYGEGSPESFSGQALKNPILLKECEVAIFEQVLASVQARGLGANVARQLRYRIRMFRLGLQAANLRQGKSQTARLKGKLLVGFDRVYFAAFRRSPWFPKPIAVRPARWAANHDSADKLVSVLS